MEKTRNLTKNVMNMHVTGKFSMITKKYISAKQESRLTLSPALIKTQEKEFLVQNLFCRLHKGEKSRAI